MDEVHAVAGGHPDMDYAEHERTYKLFIKLIKYGTVSLIILLIAMAWAWG